MIELAAIILAAGKGTRMKSDKPKVIFELAGIPMINRVINTAEIINCHRIIVVVGYRKEEVIAVIPQHPKIEFVEQTAQLGTGHAVMMAEEKLYNFHGDVLILAGDVPLLRPVTLLKLLKTHRNQMASCTVLTAFLENPGMYGRIIRDHTGKIRRIIEYKDAGKAERLIKEINTGIYCFRAEDLFRTLQQVKSDNSQQEYYLTDTLEILSKENKKIISVIMPDLTEATGVNSLEELVILQNFYLANQDLYESGEKYE
ncbi:MAG: NTP transferase domain-containing protein [Candidatus Cloacimonetes bacterium]|nr:NTP transferase domain-containing protein [Candidatus Cloacimonadota bacterium]